MELIWFNSDVNSTYGRKLGIKRLCWMSDLFDSLWNFLSREQIQVLYHIEINFLEYGSLRFLIKKLGIYNFNKVTLIRPKLPFRNNNYVINEIESKWTTKLSY